MEREAIKGYFTGTKDRLFLSIPLLPISYSLPLNSYYSSYTYPSYGRITLLSNDRELYRCFLGKITLDLLTLEHISREFFLLKAKIINLISVRTRARFEINIVDQPLRLGVEFDKNNPSLITWFIKDK